MKKTIEELAWEYIASIAGTDPNTDLSLFEYEYNAFIAGANAVKNNVDLADVGGSLHAKTCKVVNDNDDEFPCDVTACCSVGPITRENYCPNCGAKIERL